LRRRSAVPQHGQAVIGSVGDLAGVEQQSSNRDGDVVGLWLAHLPNFHTVIVIRPHLSP
jgi:hypothetical protein